MGPGGLDERPKHFAALITLLIIYYMEISVTFGIMRILATDLIVGGDYWSGINEVT